MLPGVPEPLTMSRNQVWAFEYQSLRTSGI